MSSGESKSWRLLPLLTVLCWVIASISFAATAHADPSTNKTDKAAAGEHQQARAESQVTAGQTEHAAPQAVEHASHAGSSGDVTSPQPISTADANTGGANGQCPDGPYCSTRDGSASDNGNGGGNATGEPCAGCVGKADNKNPKGQLPDASDLNAGYECDTNQGIAKSNPAHTGCTTLTPPECVPTPEVPCVPPPECVPTPEVPCVSPPECVPTPEVPCVSPPTHQGGPTAPEQVSPPRGLPETGAPADLVHLTALGLVGVLAGSGLLLGRRRRMKPAPQVTG